MPALLEYTGYYFAAKVGYRLFQQHRESPGAPMLDLSNMFAVIKHEVLHPLTWGWGSTKTEEE